MERSLRLCARLTIVLLTTGMVAAQEVPVREGALIVKFVRGADEDAVMASDAAFREAFDAIGATTIKPLLQQPLTPLPKAGPGGDAMKIAHWDGELRRIFLIEYGSGESPSSAAARFAISASVEYAEPYLLFTPLGGEKTPNDSAFVSQAFLKSMQAEQAWDISEGDSTVVIAVADTDG